MHEGIEKQTLRKDNLHRVKIIYRKNANSQQVPAFQEIL